MPRGLAEFLAAEEVAVLVQLLLPQRRYFMATVHLKGGRLVQARERFANGNAQENGSLTAYLFVVVRPCIGVILPFGCTSIQLLVSNFTLSPFSWL